MLATLTCVKFLGTALCGARAATQLAIEQVQQQKKRDNGTVEARMGQLRFCHICGRQRPTETSCEEYVKRAVFFPSRAGIARVRCQYFFRLPGTGPNSSCAPSHDPSTAVPCKKVSHDAQCYHSVTFEAVVINGGCVAASRWCWVPSLS